MNATTHSLVPWAIDRWSESKTGNRGIAIKDAEGLNLLNMVGQIHDNELANAAFIVQAANNYERVCAERNELVTVLNAIRIQAVDAQLRASYQRTALEQISANARAVLDKVTPA